MFLIGIFEKLDRYLRGTYPYALMLFGKSWSDFHYIQHSAVISLFKFRL